MSPGLRFKRRRLRGLSCSGRDGLGLRLQQPPPCQVLSEFFVRGMRCYQLSWGASGAYDTHGGGSEQPCRGWLSCLDCHSTQWRGPQHLEVDDTPITDSLAEARGLVRPQCTCKGDSTSRRINRLQNTGAGHNPHRFAFQKSVDHR